MKPRNDTEREENRRGSNVLTSPGLIVKEIDGHAAADVGRTSHAYLLPGEHEFQVGFIHTRDALTAFERRRAEVLTLLQSLSPAEWRRGGIHLGRGRLTLGDWVARVAAHDDNHVDQLGRALEGRP